MNEVRDIVTRMMEDPAPPPRPADEVLALARSSNRRRSWATAAGSGALALVMAVGVGVAVRSLPAGAPAPVLGAAGPVARAVAAHGQVMAQRIVATLPDGLAAGYLETFSEATAPVAGPGEGRVRVLAAAVVRVFGGQGEGEVYAYLVRDEGSASQSACAGDSGVGEAECWTVPVGDVTVQLVTGSDPDRGTKIEATRFLDGGRLIVGAWPGPPTDGTGPGGLRYGILWPPLGESPLDAAALAALAADPAMLPA